MVAGKGEQVAVGRGARGGVPFEEELEASPTLEACSLHVLHVVLPCYVARTVMQWLGSVLLTAAACLRNSLPSSCADNHRYLPYCMMALLLG